MWVAPANPHLRVLPPGCTQPSLYACTITYPSLTVQVFSGLSAAVLCYGPTGSGKTYTMFGDMGEDGEVEEGSVMPPVAGDAKTLLATPVRGVRKARRQEEPAMPARRTSTEKAVSFGIEGLTMKGRCEKIKDNYLPGQPQIISLG